MKVIYDVKNNRLYEAKYNFSRDYWRLYYEDDDVIVKARTKVGLVFRRTGQLHLIGDM